MVIAMPPALPKRSLQRHVEWRPAGISLGGMTNASRVGWVLAAVGLSTCGPPTLVPLNDGQFPDRDSAIARTDKLMLVASRNTWNEARLAEVSTPIHVMISNEGTDTVPVELKNLSLVDERGQRFAALPPREVVRRLFGSAAAAQVPAHPPDPPPQPQPQPPEDSQPPDSQPPINELQREPQPPGTQEQAPTDRPSDTLAPAGPANFTLVSGHAVGPVRGAHSGAPRGGNRGVPYAPYGPRRYYGNGYYGGYGHYGAGFYGAYPYWGWGWGAPYAYGYGGYGMWFGPSYVINLDAPYFDPGYDPQALDEFGPWQIVAVSLRNAELRPNQRMGGLVYFDPIWKSHLVTLKFDSQPSGAAPLELAARFEVQR